MILKTVKKSRHLSPKPLSTMLKTTKLIMLTRLMKLVTVTNQNHLMNMKKLKLKLQTPKKMTRIQMKFQKKFQLEKNFGQWKRNFNGFNQEIFKFQQFYFSFRLCNLQDSFSGVFGEFSRSFSENSKSSFKDTTDQATSCGSADSHSSTDS